MLEIQNNTNAQFRNPKIIQHQSTFVIRNSVDHLCIHHNRIKNNQVWYHWSVFRERGTNVFPGAP